MKPAFVSYLVYEMLTPDQEKAYNAIETNQLVYVSGPAGTGKSFLIGYLQHELTKKNIPFLTLSSTGISAHHIGGMTVHSFLCRLRLKVIKPTVDTVFILDEISMLGKKVFDSFELQLRKYFCTTSYFDPQDRTYPFGGSKVVFFGDFAQLPPINDEFCFFSEAWKDIMSHHELTTIKRQTDKDFQGFLSRIRTGKLTPEDKNTFQDLKRHPSASNATSLFLSNQEAETYNYDNLQKLMDSSGVNSVTFSSKVEAPGFSDSEKSTFFQERHQCYQSLSMCVGAQCMLTANLDVQNGWCNGTLGTVHDIQGETILMKKKNGEILPIPRKTYQRRKHRLDCDVLIKDGKDKKKRFCGLTDCEHTPVYSYTDDEDEIKSELPGKIMTVEQFPLLLAWGITIHKSQGMSLDGCTITLPYQYSPSLIYVALSRCTTLKGLSLRCEHPIKYDQIRPSIEVMEHIFHWKEKTCKLCKESYIGPYANFCQDCCSAPGKYSVYRFIDFIPDANPSPDMMQYTEYALKNPTKGTTKKWQKFIAFCKTIGKM